MVEVMGNIGNFTILFILFTQFFFVPFIFAAMLRLVIVLELFPYSRFFTIGAPCFNSTLSPSCTSASSFSCALRVRRISDISEKRLFVSSYRFSVVVEQT